MKIVQLVRYKPFLVFVVDVKVEWSIVLASDSADVDRLHVTAVECEASGAGDCNCGDLSIALHHRRSHSNERPVAVEIKNISSKSTFFHSVELQVHILQSIDYRAPLLTQGRL